MNTPKNWLSEKNGKYINLEEISKDELIDELIFIRNSYEELLGKWEKDFESKRQIIENILKTVCTWGIGTFDAETEKKKLKRFFEGLFCRVEE